MSIGRMIARLGLPALATGLALSAAAAQSTTTPPSAPGTSHRAKTHHHHRTAPRVAALPPAAPAVPATPGTTPAPVPNEAMAAPIDHTAPASSVAPSVFSLHYPPQGDGYVTGSSPQAMDDREAARATGVQARVPLPQ